MDLGYKDLKSYKVMVGFSYKDLKRYNGGVGQKNYMWASRPHKCPN